MTNKTIEHLKAQSKTAAGNYAAVNGLKMYYEDHNSHATGSPPLVLLHGAFSAIGSSFASFLPGLAANHRVIAIDQQAHGRTGDIDRPLSTPQMAADTVELLRQLNIPKVDFFAYSMGGGIALEIALRHPELARKVIFMGGATYNSAGFYPEMIASMDQITPEVFAGSPWLDEYKRINPHPENFPRLVEKLKQHELEFKGYTPEEVRLIQAPVMLIIGDSDISRPEHVAEMFRLLGGGVIGDAVGLPRARLAILPGTTHTTLINRAGWILPMIEEFLAAPMP